MPSTVILRFRLNGEEVAVATAANATLLEVLREDLGHTGTKHGCDLGECGTCTVLLDGRPVLSCLVVAQECAGADIVTIEGVAAGPTLHPVQRAFADLGGSQCGYCSPGMILTAKALLDADPSPTRDEIRTALAGNLCRCTGYLQIIDAVEAAARELGGHS